MHRKIYINKVYKTKQGGLFHVASVQKGGLVYKNGHLRGRQERRAVDKDGNKIKISNLLEY